MSLSAKYYGSNTWLLQIEQSYILVDPWFIGSLILGPGRWFFEGTLSTTYKLPPKIDLILLTQGLEDHTHIETLKIIDKKIPIICSPSGFRTVSQIGFKNVQEISPGEILRFNDINIRATSGAKVPNQENGYIINNRNFSLYIEPHGFVDNTLIKQKADVIISPFITLGLPFAGDFICGETSIIKLIEIFNPSYVLGTITGENITVKGILNKFIDVKDLDMNKLKQQYKEIKFILPKAGSRILPIR